MGVLRGGEVSDRDHVPAEDLDSALKIPLPDREGLNLTSLLSRALERGRPSTGSEGDIPCHHSSVFLLLAQCECNTGCTRRDVPEAERRQPSFSYLNYASLIPVDVETDPLGTHCNPPDGGIRAFRRSETAFEERRMEVALRCDPVQKEWASCTCGNARRDTSVCRQTWMIE